MFVPAKWATLIVAEFVRRLDRHVMTPVIKYPPTGQGVARAQKRLAARLKANAAIPDTTVETRQQRRADHRRLMKEIVMSPAEADRQAVEARRLERGRGRHLAKLQQKEAQNG